MYRIIAVSLAIMCTAAAAGWLAWHILVTPAMETSPVVPVSPQHAYQFVALQDASWEDARVAAAKLSWHGHAGYLATVGDAAELRLILDRVFHYGYPDVTYLGGRQTAPGEWRWVTGPDGAADGGKGTLFWRGYEQGSPQGGHFATWMSTAFQHGGRWDVGQVCCVSIFSYGLPQFSTSLGTGEVDE
ncbi:MAG: hypothetical protein ABI608_08510, partial [Rhizomicrobium sp.]